MDDVSLIFLAFDLYSPQVLIISSIWPILRSLKSWGWLYFLNISSVTILTLTSVHWADSMVATNSSKADECTNSQWASGCWSFKRSSISIVSFFVFFLGILPPLVNYPASTNKLPNYRSRTYISSIIYLVEVL